MPEQTTPPESVEDKKVTADAAKAEAVAETIQTAAEPTTVSQTEQMVTIPKKQYDELVLANDSVFMALMNVYDKFDDIMASIMNLNTVVFNKKRELRILINELNKPAVVEQNEKA